MPCITLHIPWYSALSNIILTNLSFSHALSNIINGDFKDCCVLKAINVTQRLEHALRIERSIKRCLGFRFSLRSSLPKLAQTSSNFELIRFAPINFRNRNGF